MGMFLFAAASLVALTLLSLLRPWSAAAAVSGVVQPRSTRTTLAVAIGVPLAATALYGLLGTPAALAPQAAPPVAAHAGDEVDRMVAGLAARLQKQPDDPKGWAMLGRSYHAMGRIDEAQAAFARVGDALQRDPSLLADYADVLASKAQGNLQGEPMRLVTQALALDPDHAMALSLAAMAAYQRQDFAEAARHWQHVLRQLPAESEEAKWVQKMLAEIGAPPDAAPAKNVARATAAPAVVSGTLSLAPALLAQVQPGDTVFVFARATDGSRIPLAVQRAHVSDLPLAFALDDSMAMSPEHRLSSMSEVRIEARISRSGSATPASGDLVSSVEVVKVGSQRLGLRIDRTRP